MADDFYNTLGVGRGADQATIKQAYRKLARKYHPDRNPGNAAAEAKFKDAAEAYRVVGDAELRGQYDEFLAGGGSGASPAAASETNEEVFEDIFGTRPQPQRPRRRAAGPSRSERNAQAPRPAPAAGVPERGADLRYRLELDFEDAAFGATKTVQVPRKSRCRACAGTGARRGSAPVLCGTCRGSGSVRTQQGFFEQTKRCPDCGGAGRRNPQDCDECRGTGQTDGEAAVSVQVPAGVVSGTRLRLSGHGQVGDAGGATGDLFVEVQVRPHPMFDREDDDLLTEVPITFSQAALGAQVEIPTLEGKVRMRIPAGSQSGRVFRLKGKGFHSLKNGARGDQRVRITVETPTQLSPDEQELYEELAEVEASRPAGEKLAEYRRRIREYYG